MDSIVAKLSEIEFTAEAIVAQAETQKSEIEKNFQEKRNEFDLKLEADTQKKLQTIRDTANERMEELLGIQRQKNQSTIEALRQEFEANHTCYAREILQHITEV